MTIVLILLIGIMIGISAMFAATETAITASSPGKIQKLKNEGDDRAEIVLNLLKIKDKVINTMLIGNSLINTICTTLAASLFIEILGDDIGTIVSSIVMAFLIIVFAEVVPKAIAVAKAEAIALSIGPVVIFFLKIMKPVNIILLKAIKIFCFIFRINLHQEVSGAEEVRGVIEHQMQEGNVYKSDRDMLGGILDLGYITASEIMVHRSNIMAIDINLPNSDIVKIALDSPYSRIPFWQDNKDNIIGILHVRDLLKELYRHSNDITKVDIKILLSQPWFISDNALVSDQLTKFRERKNHFACVIDEYGDLQGIITLEDILEEIVGQIKDENDPDKNDIIKKSNSEYVINGATTIRDLNRELNWNLPDENANTIAGLIIHELERIPNQGEKLQIFNLKVVITKKVINRIETVKVILLDLDRPNNQE